MARNPEQGAGWEIRREFEDPETAQLAGQELLKLIEDDSEYLEYEDYAPPGTAGIKFYSFDAHHPALYRKRPPSIQSNPEAVLANPHLIYVHRRANKVVYHRVADAQVNLYEPGGHTRRHRDRFSGEIFALGLLGTAHVVIQDPVFRTWHEFDVGPGDGVHFVNPREQRLRPVHKFQNLTDQPRLSIVEHA